MVTTRSLLLFVAASIPLLLFPGPAVAFVLATTLRSGRRSGLGAVAGVETGYLVHVLGAVVGLSAVVAASAEAFTAVHQPIITDTGARIPGLRLGDRRAHALLQALLMFRLLPAGFANRDLRRLLADLLGTHAITAGQMSYDLRRLRVHGLITRIPRSHRYRLTEIGLHHAMLLSHIQTRLLLPGLAQLTDPDPPAPSTLRTAARNYQRALDQLTQEAGLAA